MIRAFFVEIVFPFLVFCLVLSIAKSFLRGLGAAFKPGPRPAAPANPPTVQSGGELKKDPVCGTYVSTSTSLSRMVNGQAVYFCSDECRRKFTG
ncbi:MAG: hypothetical protein P4L56_05425 [Candidatus Sulfopaludibacter sp.]|nr:hypothetical protein [Candidatus Sulfopaludibacter sp.]